MSPVGTPSSSSQPHSCNSANSQVTMVVAWVLGAQLSVIRNIDICKNKPI